jgi:hypothetical protein
LTGNAGQYKPFYFDVHFFKKLTCHTGCRVNRRMDGQGLLITLKIALKFYLISGISSWFYHGEGIWLYVDCAT